MNIDPSGYAWYNPLTWDWGEIAKGVGLVITGVAAIAVGVVTLPYGGWIAAVAGVTIPAGGGTAIYKDVKEDGVWFNGDWTDYVGRTLGGFVAGFGVGICTVLGAGIGAAALGGTTATLFTSTGLTIISGLSIRNR